LVTLEPLEHTTNKRTKRFLRRKLYFWEMDMDIDIKIDMDMDVDKTGA
jgi:hypothetical protein